MVLDSEQMYEARYDIREHSLVADVTSDLLTHVGSDRHASIKNGGLTAQLLFNKIRPNIEAIDSTKTTDWESLALCVALGQKWQTHTSLHDRKETAIELAAIFSPKELSYPMSRPHEILSSSDLITDQLIKKAWPESSLSPDLAQWVGDHKVKNFIAELPFAYEENAMHGNHKILDEIFDSLHISHTQRGYFGGIAFPKYKFALLWKDSPRFTEEHERMHIQYPGMAVGNFGTGLNEGVTDLEAARRIDNLNGEFTYGHEDFARGYEQYDEAGFLIHLLSQSHPVLYSLLKDRYTTGSLPSAKNLTYALIDIFGLDIYLQLYLTQRDGEMKEITAHGNNMGYISTTAMRFSLVKQKLI